MFVLGDGSDGLDDVTIFKIRLISLAKTKYKPTTTTNKPISAASFHLPYNVVLVFSSRKCIAGSSVNK